MKAFIWPHFLLELVTRIYPIEAAAQAFDDMVAGKNGRGVIVFE